MSRASRVFIYTGAAAGIVMTALFFLGYMNETPSQILARKVIMGLAFISVGIGFLFHKEKSWKILGAAAILVNALAIWFWVAVMKDFM